MRLRILALTLSVVGACVYSAPFAKADIHSSRATGANGSNSAADCREVVLTRKPGWTLSGGFTSDGSQLLVVDSLKRTVLRYGSFGEFLGLLDEPTYSQVYNQLPVTGKPRGDSFILEVTDGLMLMDKKLLPVTTNIIKPKSTGWSITGLWEWQPVGETDIVGFADIGHAPNPYLLENANSAFVRFSLKNPSKFQAFHVSNVAEVPNKAYYRSTYSYIASLGEVAYFLSMNNGLELYRQEGTNEPKNISQLLPRGLTRPKLKEWLRVSEFTEMMREIEQASMPVGLFGWRDSLYLLYRTPQGEGTRWTLYNIDPTGKIATHGVDLPIRANHVTVIPGPENWAFLEKGPVLGYGAQEISRLLLIPSDLILKAPKYASSPLCSN
jgi:hypothetical protein